uniref:Uncharacterized protein n=1 Tax=Octactis speculum TaxID=3111310 RepID=A0A7S2BQ43_9STRA
MGLQGMGAVLCRGGRQPLSQKEMIDSYTSVLEGEKTVFVKKIGVNARRCEIDHEEVVTVLANGEVETKNTAHTGDMIVMNPGGEEYVIKFEKFIQKYDEASASTPSKSSVHRNLEKYKYYEPLGKVYAYTVTEDDIAKRLKRRSFTASWGEVMEVRVGDQLVTPLPEKGEIYRIAAQEFSETYRRFDKVVT